MSKYFFLKIWIIIFILIRYIVYIKKINLNKIKYKKKINFIKKGWYLTTLGNCGSCHTIQGGKPFSGGLGIKTNFGIIYSPNITSSKKFGIGNWKFINFIKAIKTGLSKNNNFLYPVFPFINYSNLKNIDIKSIFLFLKTLPKVNILNKKNNIKFPYRYKKLLLGWRALFFNKINILNNIKFSNSLNRGRYIVETLGHCNMCHTKMNKFGSIINKFKYLGGKIENLYTNAIINNKNFSLKKRKLYELSNILKYGLSKTGIISGNMSEVVNNSLQYINKVDIKSICSYMKNLFNKNNIYINKYFIKYNKKFSKLLFNKGKLIFKNNCNNCHGNLKLGQFPIYPKLYKYNKNNNINNALNVIIKSNSNNTIKNLYANIMPNFKNLKNYKKIYYLINYLYFFKNLTKI